MKYVWEVKLVCTQTDDVYHEGQHPPEQRWGCAACPKAFSPSACCSHLALLYPDPHKHTCYVYRTPILPFLRRDNIQMNTIQVIISKIPQKVVAKKWNTPLLWCKERALCRSRHPVVSEMLHLSQLSWQILQRIQYLYIIKENTNQVSKSDKKERDVHTVHSQILKSQRILLIPPMFDETATA